MRSRRPRPLVAVLTLAALLGVASAQEASTCYFPNGSIDGEGTPCDPERGGACCFQDHACLSNGLCWDARYLHIVRGSCTDPEWKNDAECPQLCMEESPNYLGDMRQCSGDNTMGQFICGFETDKCENTFQVPKGFISDRRSFGNSAIVQAAQCNQGSPAGGAGNSSTPDSPAVPASSAPGGGSAAEPASSCAAEENDDNKTTAVGVGVGVGVGVPLLAALGVMSWLYLRAKREIAELSKAREVVAGHYGGHDGGYKHIQQFSPVAEMGAAPVHPPRPGGPAGPYEIGASP